THPVRGLDGIEFLPAKHDGEAHAAEEIEELGDRFSVVDDNADHQHLIAICLLRRGVIGNVHTAELAPGRTEVDVQRLAFGEPLAARHDVAVEIDERDLGKPLGAGRRFVREARAVRAVVEGVAQFRAEQAAGDHAEHRGNDRDHDDEQNLFLLHSSFPLTARRAMAAKSLAFLKPMTRSCGSSSPLRSKKMIPGGPYRPKRFSSAWSASSLAVTSACSSTASASA